MEQEKTGKAEKLFGELGRKIDQILENSKESREEIKKELKIKVEEAKRAKEKLETEFQDFTSNKDGKWSKVKIHLDNALNEVKEALESLRKKTPEA